MQWQCAAARRRVSAAAERLQHDLHVARADRARRYDHLPRVGIEHERGQDAGDVQKLVRRLRGDGARDRVIHGGDGECWLRSQEEHTEYAYTPEELSQWLREAGFGKIHVYGDRTLRAPKDDALRIWFSAQK